MNELYTVDAQAVAADRAFRAIAILALVLPLCLLAFLFGGTLIDGFSRLSFDFLSGYPSRRPEEAGILPALAGTVALMLLTASMAIPVGVGAAIYLEEYASPGKITTLIEVNIRNLAGVPSIIYGLLGLEVFVRSLQMDRSLIAGACTLSLLLLPMVVMASRECI